MFLDIYKINNGVLTHWDPYHWGNSTIYHNVERIKLFGNVRKLNKSEDKRLLHVRLRIL